MTPLALSFAICSRPGASANDATFTPSRIKRATRASASSASATVRVLAVKAVYVISFLLLLVTFRSIVIPIKAIVLNLLSVGAAYGILTLVFQDGHLHGLLGFSSIGAIDTIVRRLEGFLHGDHLGLLPGALPELHESPLRAPSRHDIHRQGRRSGPAAAGPR